MCPYRTHAQFVGFMVRYKGWNRADAKKLSVHTMRKYYYNNGPNISKVKIDEPIMDWDDAVDWYVRARYEENNA